MLFAIKGLKAGWLCWKILFWMKKQGQESLAAAMSLNSMSLLELIATKLQTLNIKRQTLKKFHFTLFGGQ